MEMNDPYWKDYYDVLSDIRNGKFVLTNSDIKNIHGYLDKYPEINAKRKSAILTNLPSHVVFGTLLKGHNDTELSLITPEIFSTLEAALLWLGIARNEKESIEKIFAELSLDS
ncbi:MAG TPA: hypothetical protein PLK12_15890 [Prolixibacteraceae bacterium]|nr:hypothetical protein [Prolixibacteraceae bacterium]